MRVAISCCGALCFAVVSLTAARLLVTGGSHCPLLSVQPPAAQQMQTARTAFLLTSQAVII